MTPADDRRTVEQLILDSELTARRVLQNPEQMAAAAMLRSWAEVVECAAQLWQTLPGKVEPRPEDTPDPGDAVMSRLEVMAAALHRGHIRGNWPGAAGPADQRLLRIAENLSLAEEKVRGQDPPRPLAPDTIGDLGSAKTRLMRTLYVGSHGIALALHLHQRDLRAALSGKHRLPFGESFEQTRQAQHRIAAFEQLAGSYLARSYRGVSSEVFREPPADGRLAQALARWDVQAHQTLAASNSTADSLYLSNTERAVGALSHVILRAAAATGALDEGQYRERLNPAMERTEAAWVHMAHLWRDLMHRTQRRVDPDLLGAGEEVVAALREIAHDHMTVATPEDMAARTDLRVASQTLQQSLSASVDLACLIRDTVATAQLVGDARGINAIVTGRREAPGISVDEGREAAWVSGWAVTSDALVAMPPPIREALGVAAERVVDATAAAMTAGAFLDRTTPAGPVGDSPGMGWDRGRPLPQLDFGPSGPGCDR